MVFFDINLTHVNAASYSNSTTEQPLKNKKIAKKKLTIKSDGDGRRIVYPADFWYKRKYGQRVRTFHITLSV